MWCVSSHISGTYINSTSCIIEIHRVVVSDRGREKREGQKAIVTTGIEALLMSLLTPALNYSDSFLLFHTSCC